MMDQAAKQHKKKSGLDSVRTAAAIGDIILCINAALKDGKHTQLQL